MSQQAKLDLEKQLIKYINKEVRVKFVGGREVIGTLKGFDVGVNMVLDNAREVVKNNTAAKSEEDQFKEITRKLGMTICRGTSVMMILPEDGYEEIANPFLDLSQAE